MSNIKSSSWSYRIDLSPQDKLRVRHFIAEEMNYFNTLVNGFAGPIRTMPDTIKSLTGRWEEFVGLVAAHQCNPYTTAVRNHPQAFLPFADLYGSLDPKKSLLLEVVATPGTLSYLTRRAMAIEMLRFAREQAAAYADTLKTESQVYRYAVETLSPLEASQKRHVQLPRGAIRIEQIAERPNVPATELILNVPYLKDPVIIPAPPLQWNMAILRDDGDGQWTLELSKESNTYLLKRTDASGFKRRKKLPVSN